MSDFTSKDHKGLLEAYHSIYNKKEEVVEELNENSEDLSEEVLFEDYDVDVFLENVRDYLVFSGYVDTEDQAYNIMPHMTEEFFCKVLGEMVVLITCSEAKDYLISEGCEVEDYTVDDILDIFEEYEKQNLNEAVFTAAATSPWWVPAALTAIGAAGTYLTNKDRIDRLGTSIVQKTTDAVKGASDFVMQARKAKPAKPGSKSYDEVKAEIDAKEAEKAKKAQERKAAREQAKADQQAKSNQSSTSSSSSQSSQSSQSPKNPKDPNILQKAGDWFNRNLEKVNKPPEPKPPKAPNPNGNSIPGWKTTKNIFTGMKNFAFGKRGVSPLTRIGLRVPPVVADIAAHNNYKVPSATGVVASNIVGTLGNVGTMMRGIPGIGPSSGAVGDFLKGVGQSMDDRNNRRTRNKK